MSVYPGAIPSSGDLPDAGANLSSNPHSSLHDDVRDEVIAIATELGVEPSGTEATVRARLDAGLGLREIVTFTSDGTFTKASYPWLRAVRVRVQGGGGGGGGTTNGTQAAAGGGGGGGYGEAVINVDDLPATVSVTRGDGGAGSPDRLTGATSGTDSMFGALVIGGGGNGAGPTGFGPGGSASGTALQLTFVGGDGGSGNFTGFGPGGTGGSAHLGGGGAGGLGRTGANRNNPGNPGKLRGGGGGGASADAPEGANRAGGAGADGIVIVELYA